MAEQIGIIIEAEPGGMARVVTNRGNACGGCHSNHGGGCRSCLANAKMEIRVANPIGARSGDTVKFSLGSADFFKGAAVLYVAPILALLLGASIGAWGGAFLGWQTTTGAVLGAAVGLGVAVYGLIRFDRSKWAKRRLAPRMVAVLSSPGSSKRPQPEEMTHACCGR